MHKIYLDDNVPKAQRDMYTALPEMAMLPADAYEISFEATWRASRSTISWGARLP